MSNIRQEFHDHRDLIVADFTDSYSNLTIKTLTMLKLVLSEEKESCIIFKVKARIILSL